MLTRFVKVRENKEVLYRLDVDNYNFTRKIEKHELFGVKQDTEWLTELKLRLFCWHFSVTRLFWKNQNNNIKANIRSFFVLCQFSFCFISSEKKKVISLGLVLFLQTLKLLPEISISVLFEGLIEVVVMAHRPQEVFNPRSHLSAVSGTSNKAIKTSKGCSQPRPHPAVASFPVPSHHPNPPGSNVIYAEGLKPSMSTMPHSPVR